MTLRAASQFPCTSCGACCAHVRGPAYEPFKAWGWIRADGSCKNLNLATKNCMIYEDRPDLCRIDKRIPEGWTTQMWHTLVEGFCDESHQMVYGEPRERDKDCDHSAGHLELQIETTAHCNAACHFCPHPVLKRKGGMSKELYEKIIGEAVTIPQVKSFVLHGLGEPTLDPYIALRVKYLRERTSRSIELYTNGIGLSPAKSDALKEAGITCVVVSLNAVRPDQHDSIMGTKGQFEKVCQNTEYAIATLPSVEVHAVVNGDRFTDADMDVFRRRWGKHANPVRENNWAGATRTVSDYDPRSACGRALSQIYVTYDGLVTMCCLDPTGKTVFGNLNTQSIREVYNSPAYVAFREAHANGRAEEYEACKGCTRT